MAPGGGERAAGDRMIDGDELARWMHAAQKGAAWSLLEAFAHTVGVLQTADVVAWVAAECVEDLAADGIV